MATFPLLRDKSVVPVLLRKKNHTKKIIPKKSCKNNASSEKKIMLMHLSLGLISKPANLNKFV